MFQTIETKRTLPNSFYEATVTLIQKLHKDSTKKEIHRSISLININAKYSIKEEIYRSISLINIDEKYSIKYWQKSPKSQKKSVRGLL